MLILSILILSALISLNLNGQNLEKFLWKNRVLIIKSDEATSTKYQNQFAEFQNSIEPFKDRKLVVLQVVGAKYKIIAFDKKEDDKFYALTENFKKEVLRENFPFEIILIGLDGGVKLRQTQPLKKEELYQLIDSMPMRAFELKNRN